MNNYQQLADLLFPHVNRTPAELEQQYPPRTLSPEQKITRFAPSPTGFVHFGGMYPVSYTHLKIDDVTTPFFLESLG